MSSFQASVFDLDQGIFKPYGDKVKIENATITSIVVAKDNTMYQNLYVFVKPNDSDNTILKVYE